MKNEKKNELAPMRTINEESCTRFTHELKKNKQTNTRHMFLNKISHVSDSKDKISAFTLSCFPRKFTRDGVILRLL